jgi:hypothetical protein
MGDIIIDMSGRVIPTKVIINRKIDEIETQKLEFNLVRDVHLGTEIGESVVLFGRDRDGNSIEVEIQISVDELKEALEKF